MLRDFIRGLLKFAALGFLIVAVINIVHGSGFILPPAIMGAYSACLIYVSWRVLTFIWNVPKRFWKNITALSGRRSGTNS